MSELMTRRNFLKLLGFGALSLAGGLVYSRHMEDLFKTPKNDSIGVTLDTVVVAGAGATEEGELTERTRQRVEAALPLYYNKKARRLLFSGGVARPGSSSEARFMSQYALNKGGVSSADIILEEDSKTTASNIYYTKVNHLEPNKYRRNAFNTDSIHMPRLEMVADKMLGPGYESVFHSFDLSMPREELIGYENHEKVSYFAYRNILYFVRDGDHESARKRLSIITAF